MTAPFRTCLQTSRDAALAMPDQDYRAPFSDPAAPGPRPRPGTGYARVLAFGVPLAASVLLVVAQARTLAEGQGLAAGLSSAEILLIALTGFTFFWMALSVATACLGLVWRPAAPRGTGEPLDIAILVTMYGEPAGETVGNAARLLAGLAAGPARHRFSLHVLSDTRDPALRAAEADAVAAARRALPDARICYRWRAENTDYKAGNIRDWVTRAGGAHDAMLVLDADSVMTPEAVLLLAEAMAADPGLGLVQTVPRLRPGVTLWQCIQEFATEVYGRNLGRGFALWAGNEANYLGHNALIRTRAFAASAGLAHLPGRRPLGGAILSHDFVEAALLRRAGWGVRLMPEAAGSFEDTPETLIGYIRRDRRWCQGNMQHLRLLRMPGLHPVSRIHFLQGAMAYLSSLWWAMLLGLWALADGAFGVTGLPYLAAARPIEDPDGWLGALERHAVPAMIVVALVAPKVIGLAAYIARGGISGGGGWRFAGSAAAEMVASVLLAPALMVQNVMAVLRTFAGLDGGWAPHLSGRPSFATCLRFHRTETAAGFLLLGLIAGGHVALWLLPVALCLAAAAPLSALMSADATRLPFFAFPPAMAAVLAGAAWPGAAVLPARPAA